MASETARAATRRVLKLERAERALEALCEANGEEQEDAIRRMGAAIAAGHHARAEVFEGEADAAFAHGEVLAAALLGLQRRLSSARAALYRAVSAEQVGGPVGLAA